MTRSYAVQALPMCTLRRRPLAARFLERPNRYVALVRLPDGTQVRAHLPNPGRLTGTLSPGCRLALDGPFPAPRVCPFTVVAAQESGAWVGTVTTYANRLLEFLWKKGAFPEFPAGQLRSEVPHGSCRFDFQAGDMLVEVKSVTLKVEGEGLFPDAVTARGARHCRELAALARSGVPAAIVFIAQRGDVNAIAPAADIDPAFAAALGEAARAGALILGCAAEITPNGARRAWRVPVKTGF